MSKLSEQVSHSIHSRRLLRRGQKVLLAVSGGLDSMVLLHLLHELAGENGWRLTVAHLNHQLRGRSSRADELLVVRTARKLGLPVVVERADVKKAARDAKLSLEMAGRTVRHAFLARTAARLKIRTVVLAHHADDQLELFFLRLLRGSGNEGLAGMKWRNVSPADPRSELIRPLLDQSKADLSAFARLKKIPFREDASNASLDFQRNRIRHELLPLLRRKYQPALARTIGRVMEIAGAESEMVGQAVVRWLKDPRREPLETFPAAFQRRCIQLQLQRRKIPVDYELVEQLRTKPGQPIKVSPDCAVIARVGGELEFRASTAATGPNLTQREVTLNGKGGSFVFGRTRILWRIVSGRGDGRPKPRAGCETFDANAVGSSIILRHWRPGDRFQPIGMASAVKLQDLFTNGRIPRDQRHALIAAATESGELFWVEKLRISERFKVSDRTIRRLHWRWKQL